MTPAITPELRERAGKPVRIDELTAPPVVGRQYLVPTVLYEWGGLTDRWPVMGPKHEDGEYLGFWRPHHHIDARFVTPVQARRMRAVIDVDRFRGAGSPIAAVFAACAALPLQQAEGRAPLPEPVYAPMRCARKHHDYPLAYSLSRPRHRDLHAAYTGRRCGKNAEGLLVCPHKGFVLNSLQRDEQGRVVCPLHGLVIDMAAEVVTPLDAPPATPLATGEAA